MKTAFLFAATAVVALAAAGAARADDIMAVAKARVAQATKRAGAWDGPTTGPTAAHDKTIVYVAGDLRNGGTSGVADGVKEAAAAIGWKLVVIDGQGQVSTRTAALNQAIALKPDGIVVSGFDAIEQNAALANVKAAGIPFVGWHATIEPGPDPATGMFANVNTRILDVANTAADLAIVDSGGKAGVVIFGDFELRDGDRQGEDDGGRNREVQRLQGARSGRFADDRSFPAHAPAHHVALAALRRQVDLFAGRQRPLLRLHGTFARQRGQERNRRAHNISAGDGSELAFARIRAKQFQMATVPEPLHEQGWQLIDELNRAFHKKPWSGYVSGIHLVTASNIAYDGGPKNVFDPDNGYREVYKKIWGVK